MILGSSEHCRAVIDNDYNEYNDYNDYNDCNDYNDYNGYNDYRDSDLNLDLDWERFSESVPDLVTQLTITHKLRNLNQDIKAYLIFVTKATRILV